MFRLNKKNNEETNEILPEDMTSTWKNGYNEGRIQGYQEAISDMIDLFLNSDLAKNNHINSISAELSKTKRCFDSFFFREKR